jgi:N-acetylmuramoyl-L-alanine amidase
VHGKVRPVVKRFGVADRGIKPGLFYVLALSKRPGLLVEVGFVSNQLELQKLNQDTFLEEMARAISEGVLNFIKSSK